MIKHIYVSFLICICFFQNEMVAQTRLHSYGAMKMLDSSASELISSIVDTSSRCSVTAFCDYMYCDGFYLDIDDCAIKYTSLRESPFVKINVEGKTIASREVVSKYPMSVKIDSVLCCALKYLIDLSVQTSSPVADNADIMDSTVSIFISGGNIAECKPGFGAIQHRLYDVMRQICNKCNNCESLTRSELLPVISRLEAEYKTLVNFDFWYFEKYSEQFGISRFGVGYNDYRINVETGKNVCLEMNDETYNAILQPLAKYLIDNCDGPMICNITISTEKPLNRQSKTIKDISISPEFFHTDSLISICGKILSSDH